MPRCEFFTCVCEYCLFLYIVTLVWCIGCFAFLLRCDDESLLDVLIYPMR